MRTLIDIAVLLPLAITPTRPRWVAAGRCSAATRWIGRDIRTHATRRPNTMRWLAIAASGTD